MITDHMVYRAEAAFYKEGTSRGHRPAIRAALTAALSETGWQDISTAPTDGTWFLAVGAHPHRIPDTIHRAGAVWSNGYADKMYFEPAFWCPIQPLPTPPVALQSPSEGK